MKQITKEQAIELHDSGMWKTWTDEEIVKFQLYQDCLAVPFDKFHGAIEKILERPVFTHEFAFSDNLIAEFEGRKGKPSFQEIIDLIPAEKRFIFKVD